MKRSPVGKRIIAVNLNASREGVGTERVTLYDPEIVLEDGSIIRFFAQEHPEGGEYGVCLIYPGSAKAQWVKP